MAKKLIRISIVSTMLLGVLVIIGAYKISLVESKADGKRKIDTHVATKIQSDYSNDDWLILLSEVKEGKTAVDRAKNEAMVDKAVAGAIIAINYVKTEAVKEMMEILRLFDLTDPKEIWDGSFDDVQFDGLSKGSFWIAISITFRRIKEGEEYPKLESKHFEMQNIEGFSYYHQHPITTDADGFRQTGVIYITEITPVAFTTSIRYLETLDFIKSATPANTVYPTF